MTPAIVLAVGAAALSAGLALFVLVRGERTTANRALAAGMLVLAVQELLSGLGSDALTASATLKWHRRQWMVGALVPGLWMLFSLTYARTNYREFLKKWRWALLGTFAIPLGLVNLWGDALFTAAGLDDSARWILPLGWAGYALFVFSLLSAVLILVNLESTLKASIGTIRWQIKFLILGVGAFFAAQIYITSQAILFSSVNTALAPVSSAALLVANAFMLVAFWRSRRSPVDVYLSETILFNSLTVLIVGVYLLVVGGLAKLVSFLGGAQGITLGAFLVFLALLALAVVLLSGRLREKSRHFLNRHLRRPTYDYRSVWSTFTRRTGSLVDRRALCAAMAKMISETFGVPSVSIWLCDPARNKLSFGGSTAFSEARGVELLDSRAGRELLLQTTQGPPAPRDLKDAATSEESRAEVQDFLREAQIRYGVTLVSGTDPLGVLTLNDRVTKEPFSVEDFDLLKTIADQAASSLLNLTLSEHLLQAREKEAFQTLSAFFVHDLKNLASRLSLTLQNLPDHYDDPAFRDDLLKTISQSVQKIEMMCSRLSPLSRELELKRSQTDLNQLVSETLGGLDGAMTAGVEQDLRPLPALYIDPEQIQKVLVNLVLNASEAVAGDGRIHVATCERNGWAELSVTDNGHGMSSEFVNRDLFKPFHTTKKHGLGIGLFHSKRIVEAHRGRLEVDTEEGKGTTFRVMLPEGGGSTVVSSSAGESPARQPKPRP